MERGWKEFLIDLATVTGLALLATPLLAVASLLSCGVGSLLVVGALPLFVVGAPGRRISRRGLLAYCVVALPHAYLGVLLLGECIAGTVRPKGLPIGFGVAGLALTLAISWILHHASACR